VSRIGEHLSRLQPATSDRGIVPVGSLASGTPLGLPYLVARGASPRPCLWVNSNVHGNESQAAYAAVTFARELDVSALAGSVIVTPVANPTAFDARRKHAPFDDLDLDQSFPGRPTRLMTERIAEALFAEVAAAADVVVNLHTMGHFLDAVPYAVYKAAPGWGVDEVQLLRAASLFEPFVSCRMDIGGSGELAGDITGALDYQMLKLGRLALMVEIGAGGRLDLAHVEQGKLGLRRLMTSSGVGGGEPLPPPRNTTRVTRRTHVTCALGGFFRPLARPGSALQAGDALGEIIDVYGDLAERITLECDALVIGIRRDPVVHTGDRVGFIATEWDEVP
jgi:uncharacterized protein